MSNEERLQNESENGIKVLSVDGVPVPCRTFAVGDGVHWNAGTDCDCGTVVRVTPKSVYVVEDEAKLLNSTDSGEEDALKFYPGGFVGHTAGTQRYEFSPGSGEPIRFSLRTRLTLHGPKAETILFKQSGTGSATRGSMRNWGVLYHGRHKHYDYNF